MTSTAKKGILLFFLVMIGFRLLIYAIEFISTQKQSLSLQEYIDKNPSGDWFELSHAKLEIAEASYFSFLGVGAAKDLFLPVYAEGDSLQRSIKVLLKTNDQALVKKVNKLQKMRRDDMLIEFFTNHEKYSISKTINGYRARLESKEYDKLKELYPTLTSSFIVLEENASPAYGTGTFLTIVWLILLGITIRTTRQSAVPASSACSDHY